MNEVKIGDVFDSQVVKGGTMTVRELKDGKVLCVDHQGSSHWLPGADLQDAKKFQVRKPKAEVKS